MISWPVYAAMRPMIASSVLLAMYSPLLIGLPLTDAGEQLVVLGLIHLVVRAVVDPSLPGACDPKALAAFGQLGPAPRAHHLGAHVVLAARLLPAIADELGPVGVFVNDGEMIVDLAVLRAGQHLPAPHAHGLDGVLDPS